MPLVHEIWEHEEDGMVLHELCFAGPRGDAQRSYLPNSARLLGTFEANCHFEAMTIFHQYLGREPYTTDQPWHYEPYPAEWEAEQRGNSSTPP